jgi:ABC-2 type transport system ATP-binding protein
MGNAPLVNIASVTKQFKGNDKAALDHISATITPGKMTGLVGPDGAGKTTLIRLITGLLHADTGSITVAGFNSQTQAESIHEIIGYMPQKFGLYDDLSVIENLRLYADLRQVMGKQREEKFEKLLHFTDLKRFQPRLAGKLSGGMKQKLGLACALIGDPQLLLLDEPSVGVDPISRRELWKMVEALLEDGMGVVWSTAYLDEAEKCDTVILLNEGQKLHDGPPADLLHQVAGRTFQIRGVQQRNRRAVLMRTLASDGVMDGVIQGQHVRVVMDKAKEKPSLDAVAPDEQATWHPVEPWFEDAFLDALGGGPGGKSLLAERTEPKPASQQPVIQAKGLTKRFGDFTAVHDNTFTIHRGEIFGLLGPNGAGKSTTFKMMCGLLQPTQGKALVTGLDLKTATSQARSHIGYMAQKFSLYGHLTVAQNLTFFSGLYGLSGKTQRQQVAMMIDIFDLKKYVAQNAGDLPLGFKQRLALACAVMHQPDVLFLDEPTSGVDPITRREFWTHINGMVEKGVTVMVTTHFMDEAEYCDRIGLIYRGKNIATGTPDDLKEKARSHEIPHPTLEEAFIELVQRNDAEGALPHKQEVA